MFEEYELSLTFTLPEVAALDVRAFGKLQTFIRGMEVTIHIVDESQVINALSALRDTGIRPQEFYLSSRHDHADEIDPGYLVGAIPGPEYSADIANSGLACRAFVPPDVPLSLVSNPAKSRPYVDARNRHVMNTELATYFRDVANAVVSDIVIDGSVSTDWKEVLFEKCHEILHWVPGARDYNCFICGAKSSSPPDTLLGRHAKWPAPLYCDCNLHGHGCRERSLFIPVEHLSQFARWTKRSVRFQPVFSDTVGPGAVAYRAITNTLMCNGEP